MAEIIPAMLVATEEEFEAKVARIGDLLETIQVDVMDGVFVPEKGWADPEAIRGMRLPYRIEAHLMVADPLAAAKEWIATGAERLIVHAEAEGWQEAVRAVYDAGKKAGVAVNPETPVSAIAEVADILDTLLVMGVTPGRSGQQFQPVAIEKVREAHDLYPALRIEVDGGVGLANAGELAAAGASALVAASALWKSDDLKGAYDALNEAAKV